MQTDGQIYVFKTLSMPKTLLICELETVVSLVESKKVVAAVVNTSLENLILSFFNQDAIIFTCIHLYIHGTIGKTWHNTVLQKYSWEKRWKVKIERKGCGTSPFRNCTQRIAG